MSVFLYTCETWTPTTELLRRMQAMDMVCYRKILRILYTDHVANVEVRSMIQHAIGRHEDPLTTVKRRTLKWYGHVPRPSGLTKTILQGTACDGSKKMGKTNEMAGRQRQRVDRT